MNPQYRFQIRYGSPEATHEIHPVWKDDLSIEWALESQQWFMRSALSGSLVLQREDYDLVMAQPFSTVYYFDILILKSGLLETYWQGKFTQTDCTINVDDKKITVKPSVVDDYTDILAGMEKEYDLIKLLPEIQKIDITKRPMIQLYYEDASYINCIIGNIAFEEDVNVPNVENFQEFMEGECHFKQIGNYCEISLHDPPEGFGTVYTGDLIDGEYLTSQTGNYRMKYYETEQDGWWENGLDIVPLDSDTVVYYYHQKFWNTGQFISIPRDFKFQDGTGPTINYIQAYRTNRVYYGRVVCNVAPNEVPSGYDTTYPIMSDDLVPYNRNYRYCLPYDGSLDDIVLGWTGKSQSPTEWGIDDFGQYFTKPYGDDGYLPIGRSNWVNSSDWFKPVFGASIIETRYRHKYTLNDAYPIWSCIKVLLGEIAPDIKFEATTAYSEFMFRQVSGAYSDPISSKDYRLFITPKSNITAGEYQTPAQTAPVTLKTLLDMMTKTLGLHWFIERVTVNNAVEKHLRLEHVKWFRNGGSYSGTQQVGIDLTAIKNSRNGKTWSFGTSEYAYEKTDMPERYEFAWMDDVTELFKGRPIDVVSPYVEKGRVDEVNVAQFTSDVDMMLLNPSAFSPDGFVVMTVDASTGALPMVSYTIGLYTNYLQNGLMSFFKLQNPYLLYDMPAKALKVNGTATTALGVSRHKTQTVNVPYGDDEPDLQKLITTGIGNGQIKQVSMKLTSRMAKVNLRYDTEE